MRAVSLLLLILFVSCSIVPSQSACNAPASCPASPAQVPNPYYSLTFSTQYTSAANTAATYGYNATDPDGCGHTGIVVTGANGGGSAGVATGYVDLVNTSSPQAASTTTLPPLGSSYSSGSLSDYTLGWTFEVTFKPQVQTSWAKVFCIGNGAGIGDIILGWNGGNLEIDFTVDTASGANSPRLGVASGNIAVIPNPNVVLGNWYHIVVVVQSIDTTGLNVTANWYAYVNGGLVLNAGGTQYPIPDSPRPLAYVGRSCYASDTLFHMEIDTFRIYNTALNADQVTSLYSQQMGGCNITVTANPTITSPFPNGPLSFLSTVSTPVAPVYSLNFSTNPSSAVGAGVTPSYTWENYDSGDVSCGLNTIHQGLLVLAGGPDNTDGYADPSYVNLTATSGPNSIGNNPLPQLGGSFTTGSVSTSTAGMSFEFTFKPALQETWAKLLDIGAPRSSNTVCNNDIVFGWVSNSLLFMNFEVCNGTGFGSSTGQFGPFYAGYWYHVIVVVQQLSNGNADYFAYMNGQLLSTLSNGVYPYVASRSWANIGKSNWPDQGWSGWVDTFNVYNVALSAPQVANLSAMALGSAGSAACAFTTSTTSTISSSAVYYDLSFTTNPNVTGQIYSWMPYDPTDTPANQLVHRGIVNISGCTDGHTCAGTYINMSAPSGPYSAGKVLGDVGGIGTGSITDNTVGWSFEYTFKSYGAQTWAKVMDLGDGTGNGDWEIFFGWHASDTFYNFGSIFYTNQDSASAAATTLDDLTPATQPIVVGTWYHVVIVVQYSYAQSETSEGSVTYEGGIDYASYTSYVNGALAYNTTSNLYIEKVQRINSNLGKSNYYDNYWQGLIDTFRVYSIALNPNQVQTLYTASISQPPPVASSSSSSSAGASSSSSMSSSMMSSSMSASMSSSSSSGSVSTVSAPTTTPVVSSGGSSSVSSSPSTAARSSSSSPATSTVTSAAATSTPMSNPTSSATVTSTATGGGGGGEYSSTSAPTTTINFPSSSSSTTIPPTIVNSATQSTITIFTVITTVLAVLAMVM